jgi:uncharacterized protein YjbI with pentapeptide repeats
MAEGKGTHTAEHENEPDKRPPWWGRLWARTGVGDKTLWDLLQLLIVPLALAVIGFWFTAQQDARQQQIENQRAEAERELAVQRAQDEALQAYLDEMSSLLLEKDLRASEEDSEVRTLARARTLTVLGSLDPSRKAEVMQFLEEANLVWVPPWERRGAPVISLEEANLREVDLNWATLHSAELAGADLSDATLSDATLHDADLFGANLRGANLRDTSLSGADLSDTNLYEANLRRANLSDTNLYEANLRGADLSNAYLSEANLEGADLSNADLSNADLSDTNLYEANLRGADLEGADLEGADLSGAIGITVEELHKQAEFLDGATLPHGQKYEDWLLPAGKFDTDKFEPAFHFQLGEDWDAGVPEKTDHVFLWTGPKGGELLFSNPLHVYDTSNPSEPKEVPAPENVAEWVSWFQSHPNLDTSKSDSVSVGDASGKQIDVAASSTPENYPRDLCGEQPCVPLYSTKESWISSYDGWKDRFAIVDVGDETVVIDVAAPAEKFDEFLPKARKVLDSVAWKGG